MKKLILALVVLLGGTCASAQNPYIALQGATDGAAGTSVSLPRTVVAVDVTAECDKTLVGPYARYALKYLGVRAPLSDKTTWTVTGASIALADGDKALAAGDVAAPTSRVYGYAAAADEFSRLPADKNDVLVPALEDAARDAANAIFSLRKHRTDLVTGEAGENVFGEGLKSALDEIARLEQSYLELFLGKRVLSTATNRYLVYPQSDKKQYIICRFSPSDGLLPESDLSGDMVLLQVEPSGNTSAGGIEAGPKETSTVKCRIADPSTLTVIVGGREVARAVIPVFEFGRTISVALPRRK